MRSLLLVAVLFAIVSMSCGDGDLADRAPAAVEPEPVRVDTAPTAVPEQPAAVPEPTAAPKVDPTLTPAAPSGRRADSQVSTTTAEALDGTRSYEEAIVPFRHHCACLLRFR